MSKVHKKGPVSPEMNMTPMIDVVFQLIIFFMLVNNMISEETVQMIPPDLEKPKAVEIGEMKKLTINLAPTEVANRDRKDNPYDIDGLVQFVQIGPLEKFAPGDIEGMSAFLKAAVADNPKLEILLRADGALFYEAVQPIMEAITQAGIRKVHMVTYLTEQGYAP